MHDADPLPASFFDGHRHFLAGRLKEAEQAYRDAIAAAPQAANCHSNLGAILAAQHRLPEAAAAFRAALREAPADPALYANLGNALVALRQMHSAADAFQTAIDLGHDTAGNRIGLAKALGGLNRFEEATAAWTRAVALDPANPEAAAGLGRSLRRLERLDEALAAFREALRLRPSAADLRMQAGRILLTLGRLDEAAEELAEAAEAGVAEARDLLRMVAAAHRRIGDDLMEAGRTEDAASAYRRAAATDPADATAAVSLGIALNRLGRFDDAYASVAEALPRHPQSYELHANGGCYLCRLGRANEAVAILRRAIALKADDAAAYINLGNAYALMGRAEDSAEAYRRAVALAPDSGTAHKNLGLSLLSLGRYAEGWREYEWRWRDPNFTGVPRNFPQPQWTGETATDRTVLLHAEQGLGDTIQFCRFAAQAAERARVVLEVPPALTRLLRGLAGPAAVIPTGTKLPAFDLHSPLLSLPFALGTTLDTLPAAPYLRAEDGAAARWARRLAAAGQGRRVGLVWAGNPGHAKDRTRSVPFDRLAPLWTLEGIRWFSLQVGDRAHDLTAAPPGRVDDLSPLLTDLAETAAALSQMDLVVAVDTSVAHLAGGLGRPTWLMLPLDADWRWMVGRSDSPWYPSMRLYRQTAAGDWEGVIGRIAADLAAGAVA